MLKDKYVKGNEMILSLLLRFIALFCKKKKIPSITLVLVLFCSPFLLLHI